MTTATIEDKLSEASLEALARYDEAIIACTHGVGDAIDVDELRGICAEAGRTPAQALQDVRTLKLRIRSGEHIATIDGKSEETVALLAKRDEQRVALDEALRKLNEAQAEANRLARAYEEAGLEYRMRNQNEQRERAYAVDQLQRSGRPDADPMVIANFKYSV